MKNSEILYEKNIEKKVAIITLNRPEKLNALDGEHLVRIAELVKQAEVDEDVKSILFKGAGRCFSSGHDVADLGVVYGMGTTGNERRASQRSRLFRDLKEMAEGGAYPSIAHCLKATIAQVHGYCYGGGFNIANACDITIATEDASFTHPGYRYIGPTTDIWRLTQLVGLKKAKEMSLTGIPIDAEEALRVGLINKVVPSEKLEEAVDRIVMAISAMPMDGIVMGKVQFLTTMHAMGDAVGSTANAALHSLQTNIRYEPGEFNLFKERRDKGVKGAITSREKHYGNAAE